MKIVNFLSIIALLTASLSVFGQEKEKVIRRISIQDISLQTGNFSEPNTNGTLANFKTIVPQSALLNSDFTGYSQSNGSKIINKTFLSIALGIKFSDKQKTAYKTNPQLRLGVSFFSGSTFRCNLEKEDRKTYDTAFSNPGQIVYYDSITRIIYGMRYVSQQLRFDGSLIFRTNPEARWSLFAGIGITAGLSLYTNTGIYRGTYYSTETRDLAGNTSILNPSSSDGFGEEWSTERHRNKNNFGLSTYIPIGTDFRLGKKRKILKQTHLFFELRPGINITSIPELRTITNASMQYGLGLKFSW